MTAQRGRYTYYLVSEERQAEFLKDPDKYLPACGAKDFANAGCS